MWIRINYIFQFWFRTSRLLKSLHTTVQSTSLVQAEVAYILTTKEPILLLSFNIRIIFVTGQWLMNIIILRLARDLPADL